MRTVCELYSHTSNTNSVHMFSQKKISFTFLPTTRNENQSVYCNILEKKRVHFQFCVEFNLIQLTRGHKSERERAMVERA